MVRLKSGDPFIFGRTASELQALQEAGCPFEVVPGISSALAAPLLAGIPLTDPVWEPRLWGGNCPRARPAGLAIPGAAAHPGGAYG